ncbi:MAG: menaquinone biosynthesis protein [Planctomycetes bacterium]|nr:menaquinone biosynthesis protein [Planctomycetota bacterium]
MSTIARPQPAPPVTEVALARLGVVSFLNTVPLIDGLEVLDGVELRQSVPSLLIDRLLAGEVDVALCSSVDYQRASEPLVVLPAGALACDGPTLTVRLYASTPIERITRVHCDTDSHTSVALMQILLAETYGIRPELVPYDARGHAAVDAPESVLLIGDKVVSEPPPAGRYPHQLDLGALWSEHTSLPFVFAAWLARADADPERLRTVSAVLDRQRRMNALNMETLARRHAAAHRWPEDLAAQYVSERIQYELTDRHLAGLELFFDKAHEHGLIPGRRAIHLV